MLFSAFYSLLTFTLWYKTYGYGIMNDALFINIAIIDVLYFAEVSSKRLNYNTCPIVRTFNLAIITKFPDKPI